MNKNEPRISPARIFFFPLNCDFLIYLISVILQQFLQQLGRAACLSLHGKHASFSSVFRDHWQKTKLLLRVCDWEGEKTYAIRELAAAERRKKILNWKS